MNDCLLITLADKNYIDQAKQLFSGVYFNSGWKGDYMLLTNNISKKELNWFEKRGILTKVIKEKEIKLLKFHIFTLEFKKWKNIVFLDSDIIVRSSLEALTKVNGFAAAQDTSSKKIKNYFKNNKKLINTLKKTYNLNKKAFNSGVISFNTDLIQPSTFKKLKDLFNRYKNPKFPLIDQPILNLYFYNKWKKIPITYNFPVPQMIYKNNISPKCIRGAVLHFWGLKNKPIKKLWDPENPFFNEWKHNLEKSSSIKTKEPLPPKQIWTKKMTNSYLRYIKRKEITSTIDRYIGKLGSLIK